MGETHHNPSSTRYKYGLSYKACGPYLSKMPLIHWELDPGKKKHAVMCGSHFSVFYLIGKKKKYKTSVKICLFHSLRAPGTCRACPGAHCCREKPSLSRAQQRMSVGNTKGKKVSRKL